ncbi:hypothetical protein [Streptomyces lavendofoliae]|uniref:Uncharacterized protein n=1 Tax=Streptomyces lavendofoliae TaxID=67314 RepID=A0A918I0H9_9ACTN|nr:hypothetical protein [Streptomyces lavendofoliae]GGU52198.1 hypothetical protein GCM10010274_46380 [Streptomyces lavendofoliae]
MTTQQMRPMTTREWEAAIDAADLLVGPSFGFQSVTGDWEAAVHVATGDNLTDDVRQELIEELRKAVSETVNRVLRTRTARVTYSTAQPQEN